MEQINLKSVGADVTDDIPDWLAPMQLEQLPALSPAEVKKQAKELLHLQYENMFENFIEQVYRGRSMKSLIEDDPRLISYEDFLRWMKKDSQRYERFKEAQEMRSEFLAGEILEIADGLESMDAASSDTVNRDKLRIDTRKWLMGAHNRKRYGESKQIELATSISITEALEQARARIPVNNVIDMDLKEIE